MKKQLKMKLSKYTRIVFLWSLIILTQIVQLQAQVTIWSETFESFTANDGLIRESGTTGTTGNTFYADVTAVQSSSYGCTVCYNSQYGTYTSCGANTYYCGDECGYCYRHVWTVANQTYNIDNRSLGVCLWTANGSYSDGPSSPRFTPRTSMATNRYVYIDKSYALWKDITMDFDWRCAGSSSDYGRVEVAGTALTSTVLGSQNFSGRTAIVQGDRVSFPASANGSSNVRLSFRYVYSGSSNTAPTFVVDNLVIKGCPRTAPTVGLTSGGTGALTTTINSGQSTTIYRNALYSAFTSSGLTYQWQSSTDNVNWTNVSGTGASLSTGALTQTTYYRCLIQAGSACEDLISNTVKVCVRTSSTQNKTICTSALPYTWDGLTFNSADTKVKNSLTNAAGCDSTATYILTTNDTVRNNIVASICQGQTYTLNGFNESVSGVYTKNLTTANSCDSIVILNLTVNDTARNNIVASICQGQTYTLNGFNEFISGVYTKNLTTTNGCDSIVILDLTVNDTVLNNIVVSICQDEIYTLNGFNADSTGIYTQNLKTTNGCDSIVTLDLTVEECPCGTSMIFKTITFKPDATVGQDATIVTTYGCTMNGHTQPCEVSNEGNEIELFISDWTYNSVGCSRGTHRSLLRFDELSTISTSAIILSAELKLYGVPSSASQGNSSYPGNPASYYSNKSFIQKITNAWNEQTVTWNTQPTTTTINQITIPETSSQWNWNFTDNSPELVAMIQDWVSNPSTNFGIMMKLETESIYRSLTFASSDHPISALHPELTITYKWQQDVEDTTKINAAICQGETYSENGFNESESGTYSIRLQNSLGCDSIVTLHLVIYDTTVTIPFTLQDQEIFCDKGVIELTPRTDLTNYLWSTGETTKSIIISESGVYMVTATEGVCTGSFQVYVENCDFEVIIPNVFTPNGDGVNDIFFAKIIPEGVVPRSEEMRIYDNWGRLVYKWNVPGSKWDGNNMSGAELPSAVYFYVYKAVSPFGKEILKNGSITLIR